MTQHGIDIQQLIQVVYHGLERAEVFQRELTSLQQGLAKFPKAVASLICWDNNTAPQNSIPEQIQLMPLWKLLCTD